MTHDQTYALGQRNTSSFINQGIFYLGFFFPNTLQTQALNCLRKRDTVLNYQKDVHAYTRRKFTSFSLVKRQVPVIPIIYGLDHHNALTSSQHVAHEEDRLKSPKTLSHPFRHQSFVHSIAMIWSPTYKDTN